VIEQFISHIQTHDPLLNCFTEKTFSRARSEAKAIDALRATGKALPPLAGVPYAVKNLFDLKGITTLSGGKINADLRPAEQDAVLVARMHAAGAILVGALNMDEHAYGFTTENTHYGATRNPYDPTRIAGGSSGGCGSAVASGMMPLSLGSDTNGSIRVPASLCGIFGLKPTYGRLPRTGTFPFVHSFDHLGPFASNVDDLVIAYDVLQGPDAADHACAQRPVALVGTAQASFAPTKVGVLGGWFREWASDHAWQAVQQVANALGAVFDVEFKLAEQARSAAFVITAAEGGALHRERLLTSYEQFEPLSRNRLTAGSLIPADWVVQAQRVRQRAYNEALDLFTDYDLLIAPATPISAPLIGSDTLSLNGRKMATRPNMGLLTQPISCIGLPVCVAPIWLADANLPIGVQLIAPPWREDICLHAAKLLEQNGVARYRPTTTETLKRTMTI
jgi:aspartyl-tRNA(Asn)/glutamyl-tRNA(Gln) amidotransferase subunit A